MSKPDRGSEIVGNDPWAAIFCLAMQKREVRPEHPDALTAEELDVKWNIGHGKGDKLRDQLVADGILTAFDGRVFHNGRLVRKVWYYPSDESKKQKLAG